MIKKRMPLLVLALVVVMMLIFPSSALAATVSIGSRSCASYFQVYNGTEWHDYLTPQHYLIGTSPEQVAYCLQQTKTSPSSTSYTTTDVLSGYSVHTALGLQIILENGYPFTTPTGLTADEARYATANAIRFWLAEEGDAYQYNYDNLGSYTDAQLRSYAASGKIGSKVRTTSSSYNDVLQFSIELLISARSQTVPPHTITFNPSTLNLTLSDGYFTGTATVTLNNMKGGYALDSSALPVGSTVTGYTGNSGDVLIIKIPESAVNSNLTIQLTATGYDDRTRTNIFAYAPTSSSYQKMLTATVGQSYMAAVGSASIPVNTPAMSDLIVTSLTTDKPSYEAGETVTVTATIKNQGTADASAFAVQLAPGTLAKQTANISTLAINGTQNITFTFTAPVYTGDTVLTLTVTADLGNAIAELDESNNTRSTNITIKAAKPDLTITSLTTDKASYDTGETVTATAIVANTGYVSVSSCEVALAPGSLAAITKTTGAINAGGNTSVVFTFTIPAGTPSGDMLLTATADPNNKIAEINESNNSRTYTISVNESVPDLTITALTSDRQTYEAGDTVTVNATVANLGGRNVSSCDVRLTPGSLPAITKTTGTIAGNGGSTVVTFTFIAPSQLTSFSMTLTATADPDNKIAESDETNNSRNMSIFVNAVRPDITIVDANTTDWYAGYDVLVSATVKDLTIQPVPAVKIRLKAGNVQVDETIPVPANGSNLAVFRFTVPNPPVPPGTMPLVVTITADPDNAINESNENNNTWTKTQTVSFVPISIVIDPDSAALEQDHLARNKVVPALPQFSPSAYHTWQEVRLESGDYVVKDFWARLDTVFDISPDPRIAYPDDPDLMESGFGVQAYCKTTLTTNYDHPEKLIGPQMVWVYYPESVYGQGQWQNTRDSMVTSNGNKGDNAAEWQYAINPFSQTGSRFHYSPIWFPDGQYTALAQAFYGWSPAGQMVDYMMDNVTIEGDMYDRIVVVRSR
jgi:subtilase family serine protease